MMTREKALRIMGLQKPANETAIKKRYRRLMMMTHPDMAVKTPYPYDASEINVAYEYLLTNLNVTKNHSVKQRDQRLRWNAPINDNAYAEREIYHNVENAEGMIIGQATIDYGKYLWIEDEDFSLFLKSLFFCSKRIIQESDEKRNRDRSNSMKLLSEITYLLAQQYVDSDRILSLLAYSKTMEASDSIYHVDAMVELNQLKKKVLKEGQSLYPSRVSSHRLYVKDDEQEIGYVSFKDDRLYYGIIPLFERRAVLVKIQVKESIRKRIQGRYYFEIDLALKIKEEDENYRMENISLKIDQLLENATI